MVSIAACHMEDQVRYPVRGPKVTNRWPDHGSGREEEKPDNGLQSIPKNLLNLGEDQFMMISPPILAGDEQPFTLGSNMSKLNSTMLKKQKTPLHSGR